MRNSLLWKLIVAFLLIALASAVLVAVFIRLTSASRLTNLIIDRQRASLKTQLTDYYQQKGSWDGVDYYWATLLNEASSRQMGMGKNNGGLEENSAYWLNAFGLVDAEGIVLVAPGVPGGMMVSKRVLAQSEPVEVNGETVGFILTARVTPRFSAEEALFLRRTDLALVYGTAGAVVVALLLGALLARTLIRPLRALTQASYKIAEGDLEQQVRVESQDEIGQLALAFNRMSQEVARVNQQRRQMTADIAHDLRTPLTVIGGYIESMRDGVLKPTPERLTVMYSEIERLQHLVGDLRMLSQADAGELRLNPQRIAPRSLLEHAVTPFQYHAEQQQIALQVSTEDPLPDVWVDEARMMQVFSNLIANSLRYTPPGGMITLSGTLENGMVALRVADNGEGIDPQELLYIFDRFHRADKSRHAEENESGLGLAIVKALVEAQDGKVSAHSSPGAGTVITMLLPPQEGEPSTGSKSAIL